MTTSNEALAVTSVTINNNKATNSNANDNNENCTTESQKPMGERKVWRIGSMELLETPNLPCKCSFHNPNEPFEPHSLHLLARGCSNARQELIRQVKECQVDVNIRDNFLETALFYALAAGHNDNFRTLMELKADINIQNKQGETPLLYCVIYGIFDPTTAVAKVRLVLEHQPDMTLTSNYIARFANKNAMDIMVDRRNNTSSASDREVANQIINALMEYSAIASAPLAPPSPNPFAIAQVRAAAKESTAVSTGPSSTFVKTDEQKKPKNNNNKTKPAVECKVWQVGTFCFTETPNLPCRCSFHGTNIFDHEHSLHLLAKFDKNARDRLVSEVRQRRVDVNVRNTWSQTALFAAVEEENMDNFRTLMELKADINVQDINGITPLLYCLLYRPYGPDHDKMVSVVLEYRPDTKLRSSGHVEWPWKAYSGKNAMEIVDTFQSKALGIPLQIARFNRLETILKTHIANSNAPVAPPNPNPFAAAQVNSSTPPRFAAGDTSSGGS